MDEEKDGIITDDTEDTTSAESSTETNEADSTQSSEGDNSQDAPKEQPVPFHEHPRFKELIEENKNLKGFKEKYEPILSKLQPSEDVEVPPWFGGNKEAYKMFLADMGKREENIRQQAVKEFETKTERDKTLYQEAQSHFEKSVAEVEASGIKVDKNRLLKITEQYSLVDTQGRWNYKAAAEIIKAQDAAKIASRTEAESVKDEKNKQIIDLSKKEKSVEPKSKDYRTNEDFENSKPW
jgi:hypothetical protein